MPNRMAFGELARLGPWLECCSVEAGIIRRYSLRSKLVAILAFTRFIKNDMNLDKYIFDL